MTMTCNELYTEMIVYFSKHQSLMACDPLIVEECWYFDEISTRFVAGAFFTTKLHLMISMSNNSNDSGELNFVNDSFDADKIMTLLCSMTHRLFPETTFRQERSILMDYGRMLAAMMRKIDEIEIVSNQTNEMTTRMDSYAQFEDVEWIEDRMYEYDTLERT